MCVAFIFTCPEGYKCRWKLIILNNRDEILSRETSKLAWKDGILAGRDEAADEKGTWFGVAKNGKIGVLLSITQPENEKSKTAPSRGGVELVNEVMLQDVIGAIVTEYIKSPLGLAEYCLKLAEVAEQFNGFQFVGLERKPDKSFSMASLTHKYVDSIEPINWPAGIYGFGNSPTTVPLKKVQRGKELFTAAIESHRESSTEEIIEALLGVATDTVLCEPDPQLELQRGKPREYIKFLTSLFVKQPDFIDYGTRSHSILLVDHTDEAVFFEKRLISGKNTEGPWETTLETFKFE